MAQDSAIWDVMLQSAQVINQTVAAQRRAEQQDAMLELKAKQLDDMATLQGRKLEAQQQAIDLREQKLQMEQELATARIQKMQADVEQKGIGLEIQSRNAASGERNAETRAYQAETARQKTTMGAGGTSLYTQSSKVLDGVEKDSIRYARTGDESFDKKHASLFQRSGSQLAQLADQLSDRNRSMDDVTRKLLTEAYPQLNDKDQREAGLVAFDKVIQARDEYRSSSIQSAIEASPPELRQILERRTFSGDFRSAVQEMSQARGGTPATAPAPASTQGPPVTVDRSAVDKLINEVVSVKNLVADTPDAKKVKIAAAVEFLRKAEQLRPVDPSAFLRVLREYTSSSATATDTEVEGAARAHPFLAEVFAEIRNQNAQKATATTVRGRAASSASMK
jgi:hypothetical protein